MFAQLNGTWRYLNVLVPSSCCPLSKLFVYFVQYDQAELTEEDKRLKIVSKIGQHEAATAEKVDTTLRIKKSAVEDLQIVGNCLFFLLVVSPSCQLLQTCLVELAKCRKHDP